VINKNIGLSILFVSVFAALTPLSIAQDINELAKSIKSNTMTKKEKLKNPLKSQEEKEASIVDYSNIKHVLKSDGLLKHKSVKDEKLEKLKVVQKNISLSKYNYPDHNNFWSFASEYWLIKNAQILKWDFSKPEYGITIAFRKLMETMGYYKKKFKILIVNSPDITHMGLPSNPNEYILILSLPFMRTLDLTKVDLALILFEDFIRLEQGHFINNIKARKDFIGTNFAANKIDKKVIPAILKDYSNMIYKQGFSFQQQYSVTKKMDRLLKSDPIIWSAYVKLLNKINTLIKVNLLYKNYNKIFPSPELQINWLTPKKKVL